jgi:cytochrome c553
MKLGQEKEARRPDTVFLRIVLLSVFALVVGIVLLPTASQHKQTLWSSICGALGIGGGNPTPAPPFGSPSRLGSLVSWDRPTDALIAGGAVARGRTIVDAQCAACHSAASRAADPTIPYLEGFSRKTIYKELVDYRSGRRVAAIMNGVAKGLSDDQMRDVAAYYAHGRRKAGLARPTADTDAGRTDPIVKLVYQGDPGRDIAPCASCHGPDGFVAAAPVLFGQSETYLAAQLRAFRAGTRHNDMLAQMRTPAHALDDREIDELAAYLSPSASLPSP